METQGSPNFNAKLLILPDCDFSIHGFALTSPNTDSKSFKGMIPSWGTRTGFKQDSTLPKMNLQGRTAGRHNLFISPSPLTLQSLLQMLTFCLKHIHPFHLSNLPWLSKGQAAQSPIVMLLNVSNKHHCKFYLLMSTVIKLKRHGTNHQKT